MQNKGIKGQVAMIALGSCGVEKSRMHLMHLEPEIEGVWKHMRKKDETQNMIEANTFSACMDGLIGDGAGDR